MFGDYIKAGQYLADNDERTMKGTFTIPSPDQFVNCRQLLNKKQQSEADRIRLDIKDMKQKLKENEQRLAMLSELFMANVTWQDEKTML
jgi:hypothetical protein